MVDEKLSYHAISDGQPYNRKIIGWCVAGRGYVFVAGYLSQAKEEAQAWFPDAAFDAEESFGVDEWEVPVLKLGRIKFRQWVRDGRPSYEIRGGLPTWE